MAAGAKVRADSITAERQTKEVTSAMDDELASAFAESGLLQAGALPAVQAATETGERALMELFDAEVVVAKKAAKTPKAAKEAEPMEPKTPKQLP
jgi:hypothetical protein